jgi:predicted transposase YbfD/YdcC
MGREWKIREYFEEVELVREYNGYFCSVGEALTIVILGTLCGLRNLHQIHQWAESEKNRVVLKESLGIEHIPCYYWLLSLLKIIKPDSLNECFIKWSQSFLPDGVTGKTISFDGKTIRSTSKMSKRESALHIVSAQVGELGITLGQKAVDSKSNEIPCLKELLPLLNLKGAMVVADALHCQKETADAIIAGKADYLLNVKKNQGTLETNIAEYVQDTALRKGMDSIQQFEKNRGRLEWREAFVTDDIDWLDCKREWKGLSCIGAIRRQVESKKGKSDQWWYYISSRKLSAEELLKHARLEWSVESMHWLLDVHFEEDYCRIEDENVQQILNMVRKIALNSIKMFKSASNSKRPLSNIMLDCLLDSHNIIKVLLASEN